jgi:hypothetical protein
VEEVAVGAKSSVDAVFDDTAVRLEIVDLFDYGRVRSRARYRLHSVGQEAHLVERAKNAP